ncbi:MAG: aromatic ring-hydroxylating dioxygenase subunit alpha [Gammaproteobacteria bacterium]|nr:aromatic ring-hydroxylating dioxygenase subunit alpha [Gammaproteobacteria bacterium]
MKQETEVVVLKELLRQLEEGRNVDAGRRYRVPTDAYVNPELAEREWASLFQSHPQFIGLSGDLAAPGHYFTTDDFGTPVLATRDDDGRFRAFLNACRHRGVRVANEPRGEGRRFMCPFHNWTYANDGTLVGVPRERDFGPVEKSCMGLVELPAVERNGMLWAHPQPEGELDAAALLGDLDDELASWNVGSYLYLGETLIEGNLNWKLANDTFGETYHFQRLHKDTLGQIFHGDALAYETFGRNHRFVFASRGISALRDLPESEWSTDNAANVLYFLFPNIQFNISRDTILAIKIYPKKGNPGRSLTRIGYYYSPAAAAAMEAAEANGTRVVGAEDVYDVENRDGAAVFGLEASREIFDSTIEQEDYAMGEKTQQVAENGTLTHLIFGRNEPALHHYHNTFREALNLPPLERLD